MTHIPCVPSITPIRRFARILAPVSVAAMMLATTPAAAQVTPPSRDQLAPPQAREQDDSNVTLTIDGGLERGPCAL
ncbi:hypothetical protein N8940_02525, partial [Sphingomonadaceae bacterium]|nr:hypothetical protein [Sphingomonadaceae bacterium]